jgi:hypothetical protein
MAYTQQQLDDLKAAYASGVLTVRHGENMVTYQTMGEMEKAIANIEAQVNAKRGPRLATYPTDRGFR